MTLLEDTVESKEGDGEEVFDENVFFIENNPTFKCWF